MGFPYPKGKEKKKNQQKTQQELMLRGINCIFIGGGKGVASFF